MTRRLSLFHRRELLLERGMAIVLRWLRYADYYSSCTVVATSTVHSCTAVQLCCTVRQRCTVLQL